MYYLLEDSTDDRYATFEAVVDKDDQPVGIAADCIKYEDAEKVFVKVSEIGDLSDKLFLLKRELVLSERCVNILKSMRVCPDIKYIPAVAISCKNQLLGNYFLLYSHIEHDSLNHDLSSFKTINNEKYAVENWTLSLEKIPPYDIYYSIYYNWIVSDELKQSLEKEGISGCSFTSVTTN